MLKKWLPIVIVVLVFGTGPSAQRAQPVELTADELFQLTKVWTIHLSFSREAWEQLTPDLTRVPPFSGQGFLAAEGRRNGISGTRGLDFEYVHASLDFDTRRFADVAVRLKGNGTFTPGQRFNKPSLKIDLNKFAKGQKLAGVSTINLHNNIIDGSLMNEELAYRLYRDAGVPAPRTAYARVSVTVPGLHNRTYLGLYGLVENVDTNFIQARFGTSEGAIFKPVTFSPFTDEGRTWKTYNQMYDPKTDLTTADEQRVIDLCQLVSHANDQTFAARVGEFIDLEAFAKYMAVVVWMANPDSVLQQGQNFYVYLRPTTKTFVFIPWDQDHSFGQFVPFRSPEAQQQLDIQRPWTAAPMGAGVENRFLVRMFKLDAFKRPYLAALLALTKTVARPDGLSKQVDDLGAAIAPVVRDEPNDVRVATFSQALGVRPFPRPNNPAVMVVPIKTFVPARHESVVSQLRALGVQ